MADEYDFQINDLKFRAAISDDFPYQRATAPFRKEQFDSSGQAGDQSLTGWWTRGQYSFHKGAGVKFYELLDGAEVLNRFKESSNVEAWDPGAVKLSGESSGSANTDIPNPLTSSFITDATYALGRLVTLVDGVAYRGTTALSTTTAGTVSVVGIQNPAPFGSSYILAGVDNKIERVGIASGTTTTVLWTNSDAPTEDFRHLFWAKNRIWAVSTASRWYALNTTGGTIASGGSEMFWNAGLNTASRAWGFADTPGSIYASYGQYIWRIGVSDDGATIATPVIVADLGPGASIKSICYCRGRLGILTALGFQVADISTDGSLLIGPRFIDVADARCKTMAAADSSIFFIATHADDLTDSSGGGPKSVYEVNVSDEVAPLQPTWTIRHRALLPEVTSLSGGNTNWCLPGGGMVNVDFVAVDAYNSTSQVGYDTGTGITRQDTGYVTTGAHRFGTLDLKQFYSVRVTVERDPRAALYGETAQGVNAYAVEADGTETFLGFAGAGQTSFDLSGIAPCEALSLRFELRAGNTALANYSPTFLGYQLKALPVPERQRLLKWPLTLTDKVSSRYGKALGRKGKGWDDVQALEALESSAAVVTFTDHRTGETGSAYIDSVEFVSNTPSLHNDNGFGGIAYLTLRVID